MGREGQKGNRPSSRRPAITMFQGMVGDGGCGGGGNALGKLSQGMMSQQEMSQQMQMQQQMNMQQNMGGLQAPGPENSFMQAWGGQQMQGGGMDDQMMMGGGAMMQQPVMQQQGDLIQMQGNPQMEAAWQQQQMVNGSAPQMGMQQQQQMGMPQQQMQMQQQMMQQPMMQQPMVQQAAQQQQQQQPQKEIEIVDVYGEAISVAHHGALIQPPEQVEVVTPVVRMTKADVFHKNQEELANEWTDGDELCLNPDPLTGEPRIKHKFTLPNPFADDENPYDTAMSLYEAGDMQNAILAFEAELLKNGTNEDAKFQLASALVLTMQ